MSESSTKPIRSMTGFARVRRLTPQGEIVLSLRGVNHRGLDLHFHMAPDFEPQESAMRKRIPRDVIRGHIDIRLFWNRAKAQRALAAPPNPEETPGSDSRRADPSYEASPETLAGPGFNRPLLEAWLEAFRSASLDFDLHEQPDLNAALGMPGMFGDTGVEDLPPEVEAAVHDALEEALATFNA
ncbi:MAG: hypothetical protein JJE04_16765, partial [Acidobacteriia bacterium]|nr:hypothetical protein [Terriglobia bacterium]